jgi:hypothetical protein
VPTRRGRPRWRSREVWLMRSGGFEEGSGGTVSQVVTSPVTWGSMSFPQHHCLGRTPQSNGRQESAAGVSSESKRAVARRYFFHRPRRIFRWREGACREGGARRGLRHDGGRMRRVEEENGVKRVVGKAAGDEHVFIPGRGSSWQVKLAQTPYRTRRAVSEDMGH